jgi:hypothetical protein
VTADVSGSAGNENGHGCEMTRDWRCE